MAEFVPQMLQSERIAAFAEAMAKAQAEFTNPAKNCEGKVSGVSKSGKPYEYTYQYADLASVLDCVRPVLAKHGIATMQFPRIEGNSMSVETKLIHSSGEWMGCLYPVCAITGDHQKMGGSLTYAKRYSLISVTGVNADADLDGAHVEDARPQPEAKAKSQPKTGDALRKQGPPSPAAERNAEPARGGYGRQKNNVDAVGAGPNSINVGPAGDPVAETLLAGIKHTDTQVGREGLREIVGRIIQARKAIETGFSLNNIPATHTRDALDAAFTEWESWKRAMTLSAEEMEKVSAALGKLDAENKALDAALIKAKRAAQVQEHGADPESGELAYEASESTGDVLDRIRKGVA